MHLADGGADLTSLYAATNSLRLAQTGVYTFFAHRRVENRSLEDPLAENSEDRQVENRSLENHSGRSNDQWIAWTSFVNAFQTRLPEAHQIM